MSEPLQTTGAVAETLMMSSHVVFQVPQRRLGVRHTHPTLDVPQSWVWQCPGTQRCEDWGASSMLTATAYADASPPGGSLASCVVELPDMVQAGPLS